MLERVFVVRKKLHEETKKGWRHGLHLGNDDGESLTILFETEGEVEKFQIGDILTVRVLTPQTTLGDVHPGG